MITDFDATITAGDADQCHDLMGVSPILSQAFRREFAPLLDWTTNASIDGVEWWDKAHEVMLKHGMPPRPLLKRLVESARMPCRPGALALLKKLSAMNVPVLIVSAGLQPPRRRRGRAALQNYWAQSLQATSKPRFLPILMRGPCVQA